MLLKQKIKVLQRVSTNSMHLNTTTKSANKRHPKYIPPKTNMIGWKTPPWMKMYFLLNMGIFQLVMLVFRDGINIDNFRNYIFFHQNTEADSGRHLVTGEIDIWPRHNKMSLIVFRRFSVDSRLGLRWKDNEKLGKEAKYQIFLAVYPGAAKKRSSHYDLSIAIWSDLITRWWFQTFFIFTPTWGRFPFWLLGWNHQPDDVSVLIQCSSYLFTSGPA